jgi:hypothetical protein
MPTEFKYLVNKDREYDRGSPSVESVYSLDALVSRPVLRDELTQRFLVFESRKELLEWYARVPEADRCFHEVVFGRHKQRLKFDVDAPAVKLDMIPDDVFSDLGSLCADGDSYISELLGEDSAETSEAEDITFARRAPRLSASDKALAVVSMLANAILDELYVAYYALEDLYPTREDLVVSESCGPTADGWKYSFHVLVLSWFVEDHVEAAEFTARVLSRLPPQVRGCVDTAVNKRVQCFRLEGSAKAGSRRYKRVSQELAAKLGTAVRPLDDLFVTAPRGARALPRVFTDTEDERVRRTLVSFGPQSPTVRAVLELGEREGVTAGHSFSEARGSLLCFVRAEPTFCRLCGETHHRDNSLMLSLEPVEAGHSGPWPGTGDVECRVKEHCRQARGRSLVVGTLTLRAEDLRCAPASGRKGAHKETAGATVSLQTRIAARVASLREGRADPHGALASEFEKLPAGRQTVYAEPEMRDYELVPTLGVCAQMKLGKTKALRRYLDAHFADGLVRPVVRVVTFRQTFSRSVAEGLPGFVLYDAVQGDLSQARHPRLIVQVESLHRLRMGAYPEPVDLLVLDEAESVLAQFDSGLHRHFNAAFAMFKWMVRTARHVVCMDANLGDRTYNTLLRLRPDQPPHFHWNRYQRAAGDVFRFTADQGAWLGELHAALRAGLHVVVPTNSLAEARALEVGLRREFPAKRIALYSSETPSGEKVRDFGDVHTYWSGLDALIYTPTCSAGVSYELEHYDALYAFFCDESCDVETCRQMLGRVRNLAAREHTVCLRATGASLPTTTEAIRRAVYAQREGLYTSNQASWAVPDESLQFDYAPDGSVRFYESDYFHLWLETMRVRHLSRNDFARRFVDQVADTGALVAVLTPDDAGALAAGAALLAGHRETRGEMAAARCEAIAAAPELGAEEAARLREDRAAHLDVDPGALLALEKFQLREAYAWHGRPLDAGFVAAYNNPGARRVYRNLLRITEGASVLESLALIRAREVRHFEWALGARVERDNMVYVHEPHYLAIWLLHLCGFSFADKRRVSDSALEARLRAAGAALEARVARVVYEFEIPRPNFARLAREPDKERFLAGMLRFVNPVLRTMYGLQVQRVSARAGGDAYFLNQNSTGRLFVFSADPEPDDVGGGAPVAYAGPRPHVPSNLTGEDAGEVSDDRVKLFLERVFYERRVLLGDGAESAVPASHARGPTVFGAFSRTKKAASAYAKPPALAPPGSASCSADGLTDFLSNTAGIRWPGVVLL